MSTPVYGGTRRIRPGGSSGRFGEGEAGFNFRLRMAAVYAALMAAGVKAGELLSSRPLMFTERLCRLLPPPSGLGVKAKFVEVTDLRAVENALASSNPLHPVEISIPWIVGIRGLVGSIEEEKHAGWPPKSLYDNTFATPFFFQLSNTGWIFASIPPQNIGGARRCF